MIDPSRNGSMPKVKIKVNRKIKTKRLLPQLLKNAKNLEKPIGAKMIIPLVEGGDPKVDDLSWVIYQEFGTATGRRGDPRYGIAGKGPKYPIVPKNPDVKYLRIPRHTLNDPNLSGGTGSDKLGVISSSAEVEADEFLFAKTVLHPGVKPQRFIRDALGEAGRISTIKVEIKDTILAIGSQSQRKLEKIGKILITELRAIKEQIAVNIERSLQQRREDGKLEGEQPAEVFRKRVKVVKGGSEDEA